MTKYRFAIHSLCVMGLLVGVMVVSGSAGAAAQRSANAAVASAKCLKPTSGVWNGVWTSTQNPPASGNWTGRLTFMGSDVSSPSVWLTGSALANPITIAGTVKCGDESYQGSNNSIGFSGEVTKSDGVESVSGTYTVPATGTSTDSGTFSGVLCKPCTIATKKERKIYPADLSLGNDVNFTSCQPYSPPSSITCIVGGTLGEQGSYLDVHCSTETPTAALFQVIFDNEMTYDYWFVCKK